MVSRKNRFNFRDKLPRQTFNSESFSARYGKNEQGLKIAVVVSKKIDKRAVVRNKLRRRILEIARKYLDLDTQISVVFYAKKQAMTADNLKQEVESSLAQIQNV